MTTTYPRAGDDLLAPEVVADPHTYFAALRARDPVHYNARHGAWLVTRHDDVSAAFHAYCRPLVGELPQLERL